VQSLELTKILYPLPIIVGVFMLGNDKCTLWLENVKGREHTVPSRGCERDIKIHFRGILYEGVDWIQLATDSS
jgi:hypothetical protein